jgi:hypothetical protein
MQHAQSAKTFPSSPMTPAAILLLVLAVLTPLATVAARNHGLPGGHYCGAQGRYAPNGTYEANLRLVSARLAVKLVNASSPGTASAYADAHQVVASAHCHWTRDGANSSASSSCVACVALAFRDARLLCPYHRDVVVERGECRVTYHYHDAQLMERDMRRE